MKFLSTILKELSIGKRIFLVDCLGASLTSLLLIFVLSKFEDYFWMPLPVLSCLSGLAFLFAIYSFVLYKFFFMNWKRFLKIIAIANISYACLTIGLCYYFFQKLTIFDLIYFFSEVCVIVALAFTELRIASGGFPDPE